jgi:hypothetical protein
MGFGVRIGIPRNVGILLMAYLVVAMLLLSSINMGFLARAQEPELVPEPSVRQFHEYNRSEGGSSGNGRNINESWGVEINHGNVITKIGAANYTDNRNQTFVSYSQNINFYIGSKFYIAMFMIDHIVLIIGGQEVTVPLKNCDGFDVTNTPVKYDGTIPTLECNFTYRNIRVYSDNPGSTFDLTLLHHYRGDWNQSSIKVEALFDFSDTRLYNGTEYSQGEPFTAEVFYTMCLTDNELEDPDFPGDNTVRPTGITGSSLAYNLTLEDGTPYTLSKLEMDERFTIYDINGAHPMLGYSTMGMSNMSNSKSAMVVHGFPGLAYGETQSLQSDPEITIFHDRVTENWLGPGDTWKAFVIVGLIAMTVAAGTAALLIRKRRRK